MKDGECDVPSKAKSMPQGMKQFRYRISKVSGKCFSVYTVIIITRYIH